MCIGGRNDKEGMEKVRNTETSSRKCSELNAVVFFSFFVKRFARGNHHNRLFKWSGAGVQVCTDSDLAVVLLVEVKVK